MKCLFGAARSAGKCTCFPARSAEYVFPVPSAGNLLHVFRGAQRREMCYMHSWARSAADLPHAFSGAQRRGITCTVFPARSAGKRQARAFCGEAAPPARNEAAENAESATFAPRSSAHFALRAFSAAAFLCGTGLPRRKRRAWREGLLPRRKQSRPL